MAKRIPAAVKRPKGGWLGSGKRPPAHPAYTRKKARQRRAAAKRHIASPAGQAEIEAFAAAGGNVEEAKRILAAQGAPSKGTALRTNETVRAAAERRLRESLEAAGVDPVRTLTEVRRIAYADPRELFDEDGRPRSPRELGDDAAATVAGYKVKTTRFTRRDETDVEEEHRDVRTWDKPAALRDLMRAQGLTGADQHEHSGPGGRPMEMDGPTESRDAVMASLLALVQPKRDPKA